MSEERIDYLLNQTYYNYLYTDEAQELIDYVKQLQQENQQLKEKYNIRSKAYNNILLENANLHNVLDEIREYIEKHKIEWIDEKFDKHNVMVKFNEYTNPQAMLDILDKVKQ